MVNSCCFFPLLLLLFLLLLLLPLPCSPLTLLCSPCCALRSNPSALPLCVPLLLLLLPPPLGFPSSTLLLSPPSSSTPASHLAPTRFHPAPLLAPSFPLLLLFQLPLNPFLLLPLLLLPTFCWYLFLVPHLFLSLIHSSSYSLSAPPQSLLFPWLTSC